MFTLILAVAARISKDDSIMTGVPVTLLMDFAIVSIGLLLGFGTGT